LLGGTNNSLQVFNSVLKSVNIKGETCTNTSYKSYSVAGRELTVRIKQMANVGVLQKRCVTNNNQFLMAAPTLPILILVNSL
jgi:hypothetical protein